MNVLYRSNKTAAISGPIAEKRPILGNRMSNFFSNKARNTIVGILEGLGSK